MTAVKEASDSQPIGVEVVVECDSIERSVLTRVYASLTLAESIGIWARVVSTKMNAIRAATATDAIATMMAFATRARDRRNVGQRVEERLEVMDAIRKLWRGLMVRLRV